MEALIIVDMQNDFCEKLGKIPIKNTIQIMETTISLIPYFNVVIFTQDWHPENHCSFKEQGGEWSKHCISDTVGADIILKENIKIKDNQKIYYIKKGIDKEIESYSAFYDTKGNSTGLTKILKSNNIDEIYVCGIAGEYCIKETILDGLKENFFVNLIKDAVGFITDEKDSYFQYFIENKVWIIDSQNVKDFMCI